MGKYSLHLTKDKAIAGSLIGYLMPIISLSFVYLAISSRGIIQGTSLICLLAVFLILTTRNFKELNVALSGLKIKWK